MKFSYAPYQVTPTEAAPERTVLYRPVIRVRFHGTSSSCQVRALLDTGADESYVSENIAEELGLTPLSESLYEIQSASGAMFAWYASVTLEITDGEEKYQLLGLTTGSMKTDPIALSIQHPCCEIRAFHG